MRSGALEVLSIRYSVFSSDPRVMVGKEDLRKDKAGVWSIKIVNVKTSDMGLYQCQVRKGSLLILL